jgi:glyoxylase-like metal-dependent hydrolase (beta-lactamase superfamily II)
LFLKQIPNDKTGCESYIGYCASCEVGYVVDPLENIETYLQIANDNDIKLTHIFNTHIQADHIAGDRKLAEKTGAKIYMHESADVDYDFERVKDGDVIQIGNPRVRLLHTPGHTPESVSLLVAEYPKTSEGIVLTGDTLFRGNVGRLDLEGAGTPEQLYESIKRLFSLEDYVVVLPSHYGRSQCGVGLSSVPISTIGYEKRFNRSVDSLSDKQKFTDYMKSQKTMEIPEHIKIKNINKGKKEVTP